MQATFHWLRIETFCYATEKEELVSQVFRDLVGTDEFQTDVSESEHGNQMLILQHMVTKQREMDTRLAAAAAAAAFSTASRTA